MRAAAACQCIEVSANCGGLKGGISPPQLVSDEEHCRCAQTILGSVFILPLTHAHCFPLVQSIGLSVFKMLTRHTSGESKLMRGMTAGDTMSMNKRL